MMTGVNLTPLVQNSHFFAGRQRVKSLVIPNIVYKATYLPVTLPEIFIKELTQIWINLLKL